MQSNAILDTGIDVRHVHSEISNGSDAKVDDGIGGHNDADDNDSASGDSKSASCSSDGQIRADQSSANPSSTITTLSTSMLSFQFLSAWFSIANHPALSTSQRLQRLNACKQFCLTLRQTDPCDNDTIIINQDTKPQERQLHAGQGLWRTLLLSEDECGRTLFFHCCARDNVECAQWLLDECEAFYSDGSDIDVSAVIDATDAYGQSPLLKACMNGCTECLQLLLDHGAQHMEDADGKSGFVWVCEFDEAQCVRLLLKSACWLTRPNNNSHSHASTLSPISLPRDSQQRTGLMIACRCGCVRVVEELVRFRHDHIEVEVEVEDEDDTGKSALIHAAMTGNEHCLEILLQYGAKTGHADCDGDTALSWAAWQGQTKCVARLLKHSTDEINRQNSFGMTALMHAAKFGHSECVKLLLKHGANALITSESGSTAWSLAVCAEEPDVDMIQCLSDATEKQSKARVMDESCGIHQNEDEDEEEDENENEVALKHEHVSASHVADVVQCEVT